MEQMMINQLLKKQQDFFKSGKTLSVDFRIASLKKLREAILLYEKDIKDALYKDLGKSDYESYMCEIGIALKEISYLIKNTKKFAAKQKIKTSLFLFPAKTYTQACPYGNTLIMSPWNYPFLLTIEPLADSIAAGNTTILKPSAYSAATTNVIKKIVEYAFPEEYVAVVSGGRKENADLLKQKFDFIFFTGSQTVGKEVLRNASDNLIPVILELGGKSPCIVDETANIPLTAKRIIFGKMLNCGQTCIAPDFVFCEKSIKNQLVKALCKEIENQFGKNVFKNTDYGHIINDKHFERILSLIDSEKVVCGNIVEKESLKISPTIMDNVTWEDKIMQEEIFGPVLPILTYEKLEDVILKMKEKPKPLALYIFSNNKHNIETVTNNTLFGCGAINDTILQISNTELAFGGVGESGMGAYHGKVGFEAFSHKKGILKQKNWLDLSMRYQPYKKKSFEKLLHFFLK